MIRLPFVSRCFCRSIRVRGRFATPNKYHLRNISSKEIVIFVNTSNFTRKSLKGLSFPKAKSLLNFRAITLWELFRFYIIVSKGRAFNKIKDCSSLVEFFFFWLRGRRTLEKTRIWGVLTPSPLILNTGLSVVTSLSSFKTLMSTETEAGTVFLSHGYPWNKVGTASCLCCWRFGLTCVVIGSSRTQLATS